MTLPNWQELAKNQYLHELQSGGNAELMLQRTPTNSRENEALARFNASLTAMTANWDGPYKNLWSDIPVKLQEHFLVMDAFSRKQAIEMASAIAKAEAVQATQAAEGRRGGLLGLLGIK